MCSKKYVPQAKQLYEILCYEMSNEMHVQSKYEVISCVMKPYILLYLLSLRQQNLTWLEYIAGFALLA